MDTSFPKVYTTLLTQNKLFRKQMKAREVAIPPYNELARHKASKDNLPPRSLAGWHHQEYSPSWKKPIVSHLFSL